MEDKALKVNRPERIVSYFKMEKRTLAAVAVSGIIYNAGMVAGPWFEGMLAQYLCDIIGGKRVFQDMVMLALSYIASILLVEGMRYLKRLYVRRFANHVNRNMKQVLYHNLVHRGKPELDTEDVGAVMTKAIADVDTCVEGMRKFTTEVFDTGVVMIAYLTMLFSYDWRLTIISILFPPAAYWLAGILKRTVSRSAAAYKESAGVLNGATLDRISNAVLYRVYGQEKSRDTEYEDRLGDHEKKAVYANIWENAMQPLYKIISMAGIIFIIWFGAKNVLGSGWTSWDIAAFSTFLSCFTKLASKSSRAAKLFNAVQKAQVSWIRIKPYMQDIPDEIEPEPESPVRLCVSGMKFAYPDGKYVLEDISFSACPGEIIGVTGSVACGKSTLGKVFLCEYPYEGSIRLDGKELSALARAGRKMTAYMGHEPELLSASVEDNILLGESGDVSGCLKAVCMDQEVSKMPDGIHTMVGSGGVRLSGGQQARIALARTLFHKKPVIILDDPFSAVDRKTECEIMQNLKALTKDSIVLILSHRLTLFPQMDQVIWLGEGRSTVSDHRLLMRTNEEYAHLFQMQSGQSVPFIEGEERQAECTDNLNDVKKAGTPVQEGQTGKKNGRKQNYILSAVKRIVKEHVLLSFGLVFAVAGTVIAGILPPLLLERIVNRLAGGADVLPGLAAAYFLLLAAAGIFDSAKESLITVFGQKVTHGLRSVMCRKLSKLPASYLIDTEPGVTASRFVNDVDTMESLFTSGIISMVVDICRVVSILAVIFVKSRGLGVLMTLAAPILYLITRAFQKRMLKAQLANRTSVGRANSHVPETIRNIRMIHTFHKEKYMEKCYDRYIQAGYQALEKSNFYDSIYSPIIITIRAALIAVMMVLAAMGGNMQGLFGMSVGTAVAVIAYVSKVFEPLESIGMEIQNIQSAVAGVCRIYEFLNESEHRLPENETAALDECSPAAAFHSVSFGYGDGREILRQYSFEVHTGENVTLTGRTGVGKSTVFKLLLGLYPPWNGRVCIYGVPPDQIPDTQKRGIFGYVEQSFRLVPGTVAEQISLKDSRITREDIERAVNMVGMHEAVMDLENRYDTLCTAGLFSQGQMQLLSIARAVAANPRILLLDEITANLDSATEEKVLEALRAASTNRTVISISHRLYEQRGGREICLAK